MNEMNLLDEQMENDAQLLDQKYLTFLLSGDSFGISIKHVIEIIGIQSITDLPEVPHFIKGVINLRGKVIPVMDIRLRFGLNFREYDDRTCIVVVSLEKDSVGLIVDSVDEVLDIPDTDISNPPTVGKQSKNMYIKGLGKLENRVVILMDTFRLLFDEEINQINSAAEIELD
jgi:purine-binding chemotaxis protein CheW